MSGTRRSGEPNIGLKTSSLSSSEINEVGGVGGYCRAKLLDCDICSCCAAISCVMALHVSGLLFGSCGVGDEQGEVISLSSLDR